MAHALHKLGFEVSFWAFPPLMRLDTATLEREGIRCYAFAGWPHLVGAFIEALDRQRFAHRLEALDVLDVVVYCGAMRKEDIAVRFRPTIHAGVLSSLSGGMPNAVMEYMYWGLPVIGTDIPGIRDLLGADQLPCLFKPGDAFGFADAVSYLSANPDQLHGLGDRNRRRLEEHFSEEKIMPRWVERIRKSLDQAG